MVEEAVAQIGEAGAGSAVAGLQPDQTALGSSSSYNGLTSGSGEATEVDGSATGSQHADVASDAPIEPNQD